MYKKDANNFQLENVRNHFVSGKKIQKSLRKICYACMSFPFSYLLLKNRLCLHIGPKALGQCNFDGYATWSHRTKFPPNFDQILPERKYTTHLVLQKMKSFLPILDPKTMQTMVRMMTHKKRTERPSLVLLHDSPRSPKHSPSTQPSDLVPKEKKHL